jgi:adenosylcobinamide kinase/adenosylcobinamide-phosphate guanylyltransferase
MSKVILVTGGSRSGKSFYAQKRAEEIAGRRVFMATCPKVDPEMDRRIEKHRLDRQGKGWFTIEEEIEIAAVLQANHDADVVLVDCLTLWINNLLYRGLESGGGIDEEEISHLCDEIVLECRRHPGTIFFVTNEVGSGIVPESPATRRYRDLVGRSNQCIARGADEVVLVSCGIPLKLKE